MGCFLGCFGLSCKRKRRKPANRVQPRHQLRICSYEPLDSASGVTGEPISLDSELKEKFKEPLNIKVRKKVSFNLNVQTYEPIPKEESSDEESEQERPPAAADSASYPSNYRYRNCIDCYDEEEEDEIGYEESDLDDDFEDEDDFEEDEEDFECMRTSRDKEVTEKFESLSVNRDSLTENLSGEGANRNYRDRNRYVHSVLNPVENLSQWKAVKAKAMAPTKRQRKENIEGPQQTQTSLTSANRTSKSTPGLQEIAVDASLSNWIGFIEPCQLKSSCVSAENMPQFERKCQWRSEEDMPIRAREAVV